MAKNCSVYIDKDWSANECPVEFSCGATVNVHGEVMLWIGGEFTMASHHGIESCEFSHESCYGDCYAENELRFCFRHEAGCTTPTNNSLPEGYW